MPTSNDPSERSDNDQPDDKAATDKDRNVAETTDAPVNDAEQRYGEDESPA